MSKKRVHELGKQLKEHGIELSNQELVEKLHALGYDVKSHSSSLEDDQAQTAFERIVEEDLREGRHRNAERRPGWFTTAYFHRPTELAEERSFFVAYPAQAWRANVERCWNWFRSQHQGRDAGEPSLIAGITRQVIARYHIDERRVYVAGLSAGGRLRSPRRVARPSNFLEAFR